MDAGWLAAELAAGRSYAEIALQVGCDPSTVSYWARKHGLSSAHAAARAPRGALPRDDLAALVDEGLSVRQIAVRIDRSPNTVRHWMRRYGIETARTRRLRETADARARGDTTANAVCAVHGQTIFTRSPSGAFRCLRCRNEAVSKRRRAVKDALVAAAGGACALCGYARSPAALQFHHENPITKAFGISERGVTRTLEAALREAEKCVLLCATCHAEVEAGVARLPEKLSD
jgi:DNA-binding CsgD family transcriptional regulator